ncbi:MAG: hypothetical protein AAF899_03815 [Pseudomonadota bacterium]
MSCCYCGSRSILPVGTARALVCHGCGAPITVVQLLETPIDRKKGKRKGPKPAIPHGADRDDHRRPQDRPARRKKGKRRKTGLDDRLERFWDKLEDVVDDVFDDIFD